ncbi:hypothetical protein A0127_04480 [Thermococcus peptonophilus]|uniref:Uncharacterized protein n=1 Tax=Thermococcus peptonophilus TaxID=53952 RepID=A0A142CUM6_9EURY|nr:hypothetical protein A0127_04480 [Thermococcus peptonophilus]
MLQKGKLRRFTLKTLSRIVVSNFLFSALRALYCEEIPQELPMKSGTPSMQSLLEEHTTFLPALS